MSFSSMHNDYLDPDRHLWPEEPPEKPKIHWRIRRLVRRLVGYDGVGRFYRSVYKATDCGPSIGFCIDGRWVYCDDLYSVGRKSYDLWSDALKDMELKFSSPYRNKSSLAKALADRRCWHDSAFTGISISSIVEGSDAEVGASILDDARATDKEFQDWFWQQLDDVNAEACYLWDRDNAIHFRVWQENGEMIFGDWKAFGEVEFTVPAYVNMVPEVVMAQAKKIMEGWCHNTKQEPVALSDGWYVSADEVFE